MNMDIEKSILSELTVYMKYARFLHDENRRETWEEIVTRNKNMHKKKFPALAENIDYVYDKYVLTKKVLPSMRSMQFAGKAVDVTPNRLYNCAYTPIDNLHTFGEIMFILLAGSGVGYSVQKHHVEQLPVIQKPNPDRKRRFLIADSIEGWGDSVKFLMKTYFGNNTSTPIFDFSDIRAKGATLVTSGGKAPGAQPLKECLLRVQGVLDQKGDGEKLTTLEVHDIVCYIADAVLAGGIRRAALIALFSPDDEEMISCKTGNWWETEPQRGRANNSVVLDRATTTPEYFAKLWGKVEYSRSGEPGIYFTNDIDLGCNPCVEISLRPNQFCNLTEINGSTVEDEKDLWMCISAATFIGTLQASYTDFHYLRDSWRKTTEEDALLGVSITGIASNKLNEFNLPALIERAKIANRNVAHMIGINPAKRVTCLKPAGTTSLTLGTSSGIHGWYAPFYIRRMRVGKNEAIYTYLKENIPELVEDDYFRPHDSAVLAIPQRAPEGATMSSEPSRDTLKRIEKWYHDWITPGHVEGTNTNNISATVYVEDDEWEEVGMWMWNNRDSYNGISVLPADNGTYKQPPFEKITEEKFNEMMVHLTTLDLTKVIEEDDNTNLHGELACSGDSCEIK